MTAAGRWSKAEATRQIHACASRRRLNAHWKEFALAQLADCGLCTADVFYVLKRGRVLKPATPLSKGAHRCEIASRTPNSGRAVVVTVVLDGGRDVKIMNVCWKESS